MTTVDLITANVVSGLADTICSSAALVKSAREGSAPCDTSLIESGLRDVLCKVAHKAALPRVLVALAAAGAPASVDEFRARLIAAIDRQQAEAGVAPEDDKPRADASAGEVAA